MHSINQKIAGLAGICMFVLGSLVATPASAAAVPDDFPDIPTGTIVFHGKPLPDALSQCADVNPPVTAFPKFELFAEGAIIYRWDGSTWREVATKAALSRPVQVLSARGSVVALLTAGPTFEDLAGNTLITSVVGQCSAYDDAAPYQLLEVEHNAPKGLFSNVTFVQRVDTDGGLVPQEAGGRVGDKATVPFTAYYVFFTGRGPAGPAS